MIIQTSPVHHLSCPVAVGFSCHHFTFLIAFLSTPYPIKTLSGDHVCTQLFFCSPTFLLTPMILGVYILH